MSSHALLWSVGFIHDSDMTYGFLPARSFSFCARIIIVSLLLLGSGCLFAEPKPAAVSAFNAYIETVESRLDRQHRSPQSFLAPANPALLRRGDLVIEQIKPQRGFELPGALLHHWRGTAFVPGATAADFSRLMTDFNAYPRYYSAQVVQARVISRHGDHFQVLMRVRQKHVITVVLDIADDVSFGGLDATHGYSLSRSTSVSEIESPESPNERALSPSQDHGFMWCLNTYWSYEERDGGLYMQIESVSFSRSIPPGLGWIVRPY